MRWPWSTQVDQLIVLLDKAITETEQLRQETAQVVQDMKRRRPREK